MVKFSSSDINEFCPVVNFFYIFYKFNEVGISPRPSDLIRRMGLGLMDGALIADFIVACFLSSLLMLSSTAVIVKVKRHVRFAEVFRATHKKGFQLTLFLVCSGTAMFYFFFVWNTWLDDAIKSFNSFMELLLAKGK